jgi:hypothetical protein
MTLCDHTTDDVPIGLYIYICHLPSRDGSRHQIALTCPESVETLRHYLRGDWEVEQPFHTVTYVKAPCHCLYRQAVANTEKVRNEWWSQLEVASAP